MNIKDIAATLAILGSGALLVGCGKDKPATEAPGGAAAAPTDAGGEGKCGEGHSEEGHCGDAPDGDAPDGEGSCGGN
jgi:hypothetical protein